jgi:hypothetical protein
VSRLVGSEMCIRDRDRIADHFDFLVQKTNSWCLSVG